MLLKSGNNLFLVKTKALEETEDRHAGGTDSCEERCNTSDSYPGREEEPHPLLDLSAASEENRKVIWSWRSKGWLPTVHHHQSRWGHEAQRWDGRLSPGPRPTGSLTVLLWSGAGHGVSGAACCWVTSKGHSEKGAIVPRVEPHRGAKHGRLGILSTHTARPWPGLCKPAREALHLTKHQPPPHSLCSFTSKTVPGSILLHANIYRVLRKSESFLIYFF